MLIRFLNPVQNGYGTFKAGDTVDLPELDVTALVAAGSAERVEPKASRPRATAAKPTKRKGAR